MAYYRYELFINDKSTGYGFLVGAYIFDLVPEEQKYLYRRTIEKLPNPEFEEVDGKQIVSYFKANTFGDLMSSYLLSIIENGCRLRSCEDLVFNIRKVETTELTNIVYEDDYQAICLKDGSTVFRDLLLQD